MIYSWPEKIHLKFRSGKIPLSDLIIFVVLITKVKNSFSIGPLVTDRQGGVFLSKDYLMKSIFNVKKEYPMDYKGDIEDCYGFKVIIESYDELMQRLERLREFYPVTAKNLEDKIRRSSNAKYFSYQHTWTIPLDDNEIEIELMAK